LNLALDSSPPGAITSVGDWQADHAKLVLTVTAAGFARSTSVAIIFTLTNQDSVKEASDVTVEVI